MPTKKFASTTAQSLRPAAKSVEYFASNFASGHSGRLGLRVSPQGKKTWFVACRPQGVANLQKKNVGTFPELSYTEASQKATELLIDISKGAALSNKHRDTGKVQTVDALFEFYMEKRGSKKKDKGKQDRYLYDAYVKDVFGYREPDTVRRGEIRSFLDDIAPVVANRVQALISVVYNTGIVYEHVEHNPAYKLPKNDEGTGRERYLSEEEIAKLWPVWTDEPAGNIFKLMLLTGARSGEVKAAKWSDIRDGILHIPDPKNRQPHEIPLPKQAVDLLATMNQDTEYLFPGQNGSTGHFDNHRKVFNRCRDKCGLDANTRSHDLRATVASHLDQMGVAELTIARILNHKKKTMTAKYIRHTAEAEKRTALQKWANKLDRIVGVRRKAQIRKIA